MVRRFTRGILAEEEMTMTAGKRTGERRGIARAKRDLRQRHESFVFQDDFAEGGLVSTSPQRASQAAITGREDR